MITTTIKLTKKEVAPCGKIVFLWFEPAEKFSFKEGQFMILESGNCKDQNGNKIKRAYSMATTNQNLQNKNTIGFIIKNSSEHGMSNFLVNKIKIEEEITLSGPTGKLIDDRSQKNYLFICNGSGLSPIFSHYIHLTKETKEFEKIVTIFGERYQSHLLESVEDNLQIQTDNIKNMIFLSKEQNLKPIYHRGHVQDGISDALKFLQTKNIKVIISGKPAMADDCKSLLIQKGIKESQIAIETY